MRLVVLILAALALPTSAQEQPADAEPPCGAYSAAVEHCLKAIATITADGIGDDSAPRATLRETRIQTQLLLIESHLAGAHRAGCPAPSGPLFTGKYLLEALECSTARLENQAKRILTEPDACKMSSWEGSDSPHEESGAVSP